VVEHFLLSRAMQEVQADLAAAVEDLVQVDQLLQVAKVMQAAQEPHPHHIAVAVVAEPVALVRLEPQAAMVEQVVHQVLQEHRLHAAAAVVEELMQPLQQARVGLAAVALVALEVHRQQEPQEPITQAVEVADLVTVEARQRMAATAVQALSYLLTLTHLHH
jgi:hypothetical protein